MSDLSWKQYNVMSGEGCFRKQITMSRICGEKNRLQYRYNVVSSKGCSRKQKAMSRIFSEKNRRWTLDFDRNVDNSISDPLFILKLKWIIDSLLITI